MMDEPRNIHLVPLDMMPEQSLTLGVVLQAAVPDTTNDPATQLALSQNVEPEDVWLYLSPEATVLHTAKLPRCVSRKL